MCTAGQYGNEYFGISTAHAALNGNLKYDRNEHQKNWKQIFADLAVYTWCIRSHKEGGIHITGIPVFVIDSSIL